MKRWILITCLGALTGCARFESQPLSPAHTAAQLDGRRLDDPGLRQFMELTLGHPVAAWPLRQWDLTTLSLAAFYFHPSLELARARWAVAAAGIKTAGGRPNPTLTIVPGYDTTATVISHWLPLGGLDWPLETAGKRNKRIAGAQAQADSARWDVVTAAWQVRSTVRDTLAEWQVAGRRAALLDEQCQLEEEIVTRLQERIKAGEISRPESLAAQISLHRSEVDRQDAQSKSSDAHARLAAALGLPAAALDGIKLVAEPATNMPPELTLPAARRLALTTRSDIMGALADYAAADDDLRLEIARQYPDVHVNPGYQYNQGDNQWMLGITMELPVLNQNQGPIAEAQARRKLAAAKFTALQAQVIGQIDEAVTGYKLAQKQLGYGRALQTEAQAQEAAARAQSEAGETDQSERLGAEVERVGASLVQLDNADQLQHARGALEDALQHPLDELTPAVFEHLSEAPVKKQFQP
jgi:outer membrane protein TolC